MSSAPALLRAGAQAQEGAANPQSTKIASVLEQVAVLQEEMARAHSETAVLFEALSAAQPQDVPPDPHLERTTANAAFLAALCAPAYVRIKGATNNYGVPLRSVNGDYKKTGDMRNGCAVYTKVWDDEFALWSDQDGQWMMGGV